MLKVITVTTILILIISLSDRTDRFSPSQILFKQEMIDSTTKAPLGLPMMIIPDDNKPTVKKVALGRKLFMDRRLSHNNTISCGMCHVPEEGFTSRQIATAVGIEGRSHRRNAPTIFNVGYYKFLFHDGREFTLENQVIAPMLAFNEMNNPSIGYVIEKIRNSADYDGLFEEVYGGGVTIGRLTKAIAAYERTLVSGNSKFDQWYFNGDKSALNAEEIAGFKIFKGKGGCITCHTIDDQFAIFTDQSFHNTGIGWERNNKVVNKQYESETFPVELAPGIVVKVKHDQLEAASEKPQNDVGRSEVTENPDDNWKYKTPSLRNLVFTAPYMHDGSLSTLEDVVNFYDKGGEENPSIDPLIKPLNLSLEEKTALAAFLKTLSGDNVKRLEKEARASFIDTKLGTINYTDYQKLN